MNLPSFQTRGDAELLTIFCGSLSDWSPSKLGIRRCGRNTAYKWIPPESAGGTCPETPLADNYGVHIAIIMVAHECRIGLFDAFAIPLNPPPGAISAGLIDATSNVGPFCARHPAAIAAIIQCCLIVTSVPCMMVLLFAERRHGIPTGRVPRPAAEVGPRLRRHAMLVAKLSVE
jgi:hypothetical protein